MSPPAAILSLVLAERLLELALARRNTRRLLGEGGIEHGAGHYPLFVLLHGAWLLSMFLLARRGAPVLWPFAALYGLLLLARVWVMASLGRYWTTRVISLPGRPLVRRGPYRFLSHPNYLVVTAEIAVLPLAFGLWRVALVFSLLNALLLRERLRVENAALVPRRGL
jgi:methyltransferase